MDSSYRKFNQSASKIEAGSLEGGMRATNDVDGLLILEFPDMDGSFSSQLVQEPERKLPPSPKSHKKQSFEKELNPSEPLSFEDLDASRNSFVPTADVPEESQDWVIEKPAPPNERRASDEKSNSGTSSSSVHLMNTSSTTFYEKNPVLIQQLTRRQATMGSQIILFADVDDPSRSSDICVKVAHELATQTNACILVVDADTTSKTLSQKASKDSNHVGLTDLFRGECKLLETIRRAENPKVNFLCCGKRPLDFSRAEQTFDSVGAHMIGTMRKQYDFVLVSSGLAFDKSLHFWGRFSDIGFLTIDPMSASRSLSKAAVVELQRHGTRIGGCITSFVKEAT